MTTLGLWLYVTHAGYFKGQLKVFLDLLCLNVTTSPFASSLVFSDLSHCAYNENIRVQLYSPTVPHESKVLTIRQSLRMLAPAFTGMRSSFIRY